MDQLPKQQSIFFEQEEEHFPSRKAGAEIDISNTLNRDNPTRYLQLMMNHLQTYMNTFTEADDQTGWYTKDQGFLEQDKGKNPYSMRRDTLSHQLNIPSKLKMLKNIKSKLEDEKFKRSHMSDEQKDKKIEQMIETLQKKYVTEILQTVYSYPSTYGRMPHVNDTTAYKMACLEKTILCHIYLSQLGISYSIAQLPGHTALVIHIGGENRYMDPRHFTTLKKIDISCTNKSGMYDMIPGLYKSEADDPYHASNKLYRGDTNAMSNDQMISTANQILMAKILQNMGANYYSEQKYEKALEYRNKSLDLNPQNDGILCNMGSYYHAQKEYEKALEYRNKSLDLNPQNVNTLGNMGMYYYLLRANQENHDNMQQAHDQALKYYDQAVELNPKYGNGRYVLGLLYAGIGNNQQLAKCRGNALQYGSDKVKKDIKQDKKYYPIYNALKNKQ